MAFFSDHNRVQGRRFLRGNTYRLLASPFLLLRTSKKSYCSDHDHLSSLRGLTMRTTNRSIRFHDRRRFRIVCCHLPWLLPLSALDAFEVTRDLTVAARRGTGTTTVVYVVVYYQEMGHERSANHFLLFLGVPWNLTLYFPLVGIFLLFRHNWIVGWERGWFFVKQIFVFVSLVSETER